MTVPATTQQKAAAGRGIIRMLYAMSRHARVFGLEHPRTTAQMEGAWAEILALLPASGMTVLADGDRLAVESVFLDSGPAEQRFARFLKQQARESYEFTPAFSFSDTKALVGSLLDVSETAAPEAEQEDPTWLAFREELFERLRNDTLSPAEVPERLAQFAQDVRSVSAVDVTDNLQLRFWRGATDDLLRKVLLSAHFFYVPSKVMLTALEAWIASGDERLAATVLRNYGAAVDGRDAEGRRRSARGLPELAELYALVIPDFVPKLMRAVSIQLMREADVRMQSLLSTALVRLSYTVQQQRDYVSSAAASDALDEIVHRRPVLGVELRPRISVESRLPEFVDEALAMSQANADLVVLLKRYAVPVAEILSARFLNASLRQETIRIVNLAAQLGEETHRELVRRLETGSSEEALTSVGLLSSLSPDETAAILPGRAREWTRNQQDSLVRQLSIASSPRRGAILLRLLTELDPLIVPAAIDEIGMSGETAAASSLIELLLSDPKRRFGQYGRVKTIEALGRLRATEATTVLDRLLQERRLVGWAQPRELRIAALQALHMIDPERAARLVPAMGITRRELSIGPLAVDPQNPWARQRRYQRIFPTRPVRAVASSHGTQAGLEIVEISLGGGKARRIGPMQSGGSMTLRLQVAMRRVQSQVLVRDVAEREVTFEIAEIGLPERSRLRQLLLAYAPTASAA